jgi:hypothetical protein
MTTARVVTHAPACVEMEPDALSVLGRGSRRSKLDAEFDLVKAPGATQRFLEQAYLVFALRRL